MSGINSNHNAEFTNYIAARWTHLVRSAVLLGCNVHDAEDLAQETALKCYVAWDRVRRAANIDAYVYRILVNQHRDRRRRRWWGERPTDNPTHVVDSTRIEPSDAVEDAMIATHALAELNTKQREVVIARLYLDLSVAETADVLGLSPGTVKSRLARALALLAKNPNFHTTPSITEGGDRHG